MDEVLRRFSARMANSNVSLFFYAGHGIQVDGRNFLLPTDARLRSVDDLSKETVELSRILETMEHQRRTNIVLLDACRDSPFQRALAGVVGGRSIRIGRGLAPVERNSGGGTSEGAVGTLISYATKHGTVADDGSGANSPYTSAVLDHMEKPGLEISAMLRRVREAVMERTNNRQIPWEYGSLLGEFYFKPPSTEQLQLAALVAGSPRFAKHREGTILDNVTQLLWASNPNTLGGELLLWSEARERTASLTIAGLRGWRLPTRSELSEMIVSRDPSIERVFRNLGDLYWTGSEYNADTAYVVDVRTGVTAVRPHNSRGPRAWAVRRLD